MVCLDHSRCPLGGCGTQGWGQTSALAPGPSRDAPRRLWAQVRSRSSSVWGLTLSSWGNERRPPTREMDISELLEEGLATVAWLWLSWAEPCRQGTEWVLVQM